MAMLDAPLPRAFALHLPVPCASARRAREQGARRDGSGELGGRTSPSSGGGSVVPAGPAEAAPRSGASCPSPLASCNPLHPALHLHTPSRAAGGGGNEASRQPSGIPFSPAESGVAWMSHCHDHAVNTLHPSSSSHKEMVSCV